jgi:hypothetical protein
MIECRECGRLFSFLPTHLRRAHGMDAATYRARWEIPSGVPLASDDYREAHREKLRIMAETGVLRRDPAAASETAREAGRGERVKSDLAQQAERARAIPHEQLPPGAKRADGRDADRAREYQRTYRSKNRDA